MRYLLRDRFLGAFLGLVIAEELSAQEKKISAGIKPQHISWLEINQGIVTKIPLHLEQSLFWKNLNLNFGEKITVSELALAVLPIILYYHDDLHQLESLLYQHAKYWRIPLSNLDGILWWSAAISLILREKLVPENLWQQLAIICKIFSTSFRENLTSLQTLFNQGLSIKEITEELYWAVNPSNFPFLLSLYCFSQTPEDFSLALKQAMKVENRTAELLVLTGFLSGAHNIGIGLPVKWDKFCQNRNDHQKICQLGRKIFDLWSGVYFPGNNVNISAIIATPRTLQNRPHLTIISQKEYESK